jgi:hypothetical protein
MNRPKCQRNHPLVHRAIPLFLHIPARTFLVILWLHCAMTTAFLRIVRCVWIPVLPATWFSGAVAAVQWQRRATRQSVRRRPSYHPLSHQHHEPHHAYVACWGAATAATAAVPRRRKRKWQRPSLLPASVNHEKDVPRIADPPPRLCDRAAVSYRLNHHGTTVFWRSIGAHKTKSTHVASSHDCGRCD